MALAHEAERESPAQEADEQMRAEKLLRMLKAEEEDALGYAESEIQGQQIEALKRYFGEKYGDEEDGRSQVTTREVYETIAWTRPDLLRVFGSGGNVLYLEETNPEDAHYAKDAADYLQWIFWNDNPGFEILDDYAFDGLLHRRGYVAVYWEDREYQAPQQLTGLGDEQLQMLWQQAQAGQIEITGQDVNDDSEAGGMALEIRRLKSPARAVIETVAPEDMRLTGRAVTIDTSRYVGRVLRLMRGEIARKWPEKEDEIRGYRAGGQGAIGSVRRAEDVRAERFNDDTHDWREAGDEASEELEVLEEYLRVDLNDDGYPEMIRSYRLGDVLLDFDEVEENPFASWTPDRVPHRFMGLSIHDTTADLQRQSTVITRAGLDALYQSVVNREALDKNKVDLESALATYSGAKVLVDGSPGDAILPLTGGLDTASVAWTALEVIRRRMEDRTGATRQTRGLDADVLSKDHSGVALDKLQLNADARKEMMARNMAAGLGDLFSKLYRLVCRNQNEARQAKVGGKWCKFDPRTWNANLRATVHCGGMNRENTLQGHMLIGAEQEKVIETLGPGNPLVTATNRYNWQEELCRMNGHKSAERYFTEPPQVPETGPDGQPVMDEQGQPKTKPWAPEPQPDPDMAKVQADAQAKQSEMQLRQQESQATLQLKTQESQANLALADKKDTAQLQHDEQKAALELQLAQEKAAAEIALADKKAQAEMDLAWAKFQFEMQMAERKLEAEQELARMQLAVQRDQHAEATAAKQDMHSEKVAADVKISKNRPGGALDE